MGSVGKWILGGALLLTALSAFGQSAGGAEQGWAATEPNSTASSQPLDPASSAAAYDQRSGWLQPGVDPENRLGSPFLKHLVGDQKQFWTFPTRLKVNDLKWIVPSAGVLTAFIASDSWWAKQVPAGHVAVSKTFSNYTTYSFVALSGASLMLGQLNHDDHMWEAGLLSGEAAINSLGVTYLFKTTTQRQRPDQGNGNGDFFTGGYSFPSQHAAIAWSIASVWAHEYPGWLSQVAAYGLATGVSITRVTAKEHFPSDVIVGSALGWYFGRQVYRAHHDPEVGGSGWGNFIEEKTGEKTRNPDYMASPYVPLDSWIYPALQRLIAMGYLESQILGMRPWTRMACARLLDDAADKFPGNGVDEGSIGKLYATLTHEFAPEIERLEGAPNVGAQVESVYTRSTGIFGTPLRDAFNFGQTLVNDYDRPYWTGFNNVTGTTADAESGPVSFSLRAEYQHAPAMPSYSQPVQDAVAAANFVPPLPNGTAQANQLELLDSMASVNINNLQVSFGIQSLWLGPGQSGPFLMSNNAAPFPMVRLDDVRPHKIPGISRVLGPTRFEYFIGQLSGHHWEYCTAPTCQPSPDDNQVPNQAANHVVGPNIIPQPFIQGGKISFQPTRNLEFGMGYTAMFGGPGLPVTFGNYFRTFYIHSPTAAENPGKRISAADITFRVPGLENWLTVYLDSMVVDEFSPIGSTRASVNPGIYMPRIPKLAKLDFRAEGLNESRTQDFTNGIPVFSPGFVYFDERRYRDGYTNNGVLMGSPFGRVGRGGEGWLTYWLSSRNKVQLGYRLQNSWQKLIGGGRLADYSASSEFLLGHNLSVSGFFQYEQWMFPVLNAARQSDETAAVQLTFYPRWRIR
jgi:membrane-associated phospholipid phosphatase